MPAGTHCAASTTVCLPSSTPICRGRPGQDAGRQAGRRVHWGGWVNERAESQGGSACWLAAKRGADHPSTAGKQSRAIQQPSTHANEVATKVAACTCTHAPPPWHGSAPPTAPPAQQRTACSRRPPALGSAGRRPAGQSPAPRGSHCPRCCAPGGRRCLLSFRGQSGSPWKHRRQRPPPQTHPCTAHPGAGEAHMAAAV